MAMTSSPPRRPPPTMPLPVPVLFSAWANEEDRSVAAKSALEAVVAKERQKLRGAMR